MLIALNLLVWYRNCSYMLLNLFKSNYLRLKLNPQESQPKTLEINLNITKKTPFAFCRHHRRAGY